MTAVAVSKNLTREPAQADFRKYFVTVMPVNHYVGMQVS